MDCSMPGFSVLYYLLEVTQTHVHWVGDAGQSSSPLSLPSSFTLNLSQYWGLSQWVGSLHQVANILYLQFQHQCFWWVQSWFPLEFIGLISLQSKGLSRVFSSATIGKHQFFGAQPSLWSNSPIHTWLLGKNIALTICTFVSKANSLLSTLPRFVITVLPRSKHLLISWLQSPSTVILEPKKIRSVTVCTSSPLFAVKWWD